MKQRRITFFCLILHWLTLSGYAQEVVNFTKYEVQTFGSVATNKQTPFWMASNRYGIVPIEANNAYLRSSINHHQSINSKFGWKAGLDIIASTPRHRNIYIQQLYTELFYKGLHLSIGSKESYKYNQTITDPKLSSGDPGLSTNARPIPGFDLYIPQFKIIPLTGGWLQGKGNFFIGRSLDTEYLNSFINKKQFYIKNTLWHNKSAYLQIKDTKNNFPVSAILGIRHVAQWGGISTDPNIKTQVQPHSLKDFIRVALGKSGGSDASLSAQKNALGAHYGTYDFRIGYTKKDWSVNAYYQHLFNDASGMEFNNSIDGLKGIQIEIHKFPWLNKIVLEHLYTLNQSGPFHFIEYDHSKYPGYGGGGDNYYNNNEYTTGASYFNHSLGSPFLISPAYNTDGALGFKHNRIEAWHLGTEGRIVQSISYRFLLSTMESFGTPYAPTIKKLTNISFKTDLFYDLKNWTISASIATDKGSLLGDHFGFSLSITKWGILHFK